MFKVYGKSLSWTNADLFSVEHLTYFCELLVNE